MSYNPLLDYFETTVPVRLQWQLVLEDISKKVEKAIVKDRISEAFMHLNILDLVCQETAAYYREYGFEIIGKGTGNEGLSIPSTNDALVVQATVSELAFQSGEVLSLID